VWYGVIPLSGIAAFVGWMLRPGKQPSEPRKFAILAAAVPPFVFAVAAVVFQLLYNANRNTGLSGISNVCFMIASGLICADLLFLAVFAVMRKTEIARGIGFGVCVIYFIYIAALLLLDWLGEV
jgi:Ca2+/Na+ antiporter